MARRSKHKDPFKEALSVGHSRAWEGDWAGAVSAYNRAVELHPEDPLVHMNLGLAYLNLGKLQEAVDEYVRADKLRTGDTVAKTKVAQLYERLGQQKQAAQTYLSLAELYRERGDLNQAIPAWKAALRLSPNLMEPHRQLAAAAQTVGQTGLAVESLLSLAQLHQAQGERGQAIALCREALELAPHNAHAQQVEEMIRRGTTRPQKAEAVRETGTATKDDDLSPVAKATRRAVTQLAERVFDESLSGFGSDNDRADISALIAKALASQKQGRVEEAIRYYEEIVAAGQQSPEVLFNLGRLYQEALRPEEAIAFLSRTVEDPDFSMASHFALGQCHQLQGQFDQALEHLLEAVKIVDLRTVGRDQVDDLIQLYGQLADSYEAKGDSEKAMAFANTLADFLSGKGWEDKVMEARHRIQILSSKGETVSIAEFLSRPNGDEVLDALAKSQELLAEKRFVGAVDVCFWAIGQAPDYLPLHKQLAEILVAQDRIGEAIEKYQAIARVYTVRGQRLKAIDTYKRALEVFPMSADLHSQMIELLIGQGEVDQALEHYITLADSYYRLAEVDQAIEKYKEALYLAPRGSPERQWDVQIQRRLADIYLQRLNWPEAIAGYEYIVERQPNDTELQRHLLTLYRKLGQKQKSRSIIETMVKTCDERGDLYSAIELLEEEAELTPDDDALRIHLGEICVKAGRKKRAIDAWSQALQTQLSKGQRAQASATVRRIVALNPPNVSAYKKLLATL